MAKPDQGILARLAILLLASLLQFHLLALDERLLPDEAHFMTFARGAAVQGEWLLPGALDKPPLSMYFSAVSMVIVGNTADSAGVLHLDARAGEFAGKLPNALLALVFVALMMRLCRRLSSETGAPLAGLLAAASPFTLSYGPGAFTDMSLLCFVAAALCCGMSRRWGWAGAMLGLALWCKPQALLASPLIFALPFVLRMPTRPAWTRMLPPFALLALALLLWDMARPETSIFQLAAANNLRPQLLANVGDWGARLAAWLDASAWLLGAPLVTGVALVCAALGLRTSRNRAVIRPLLVFIALFVAIHTIFNINLYPRYQFLLLPPMVMLVAGASGRRRKLSIALAAMVALGGVWTAQQGAPLEANRRDQAGILALAEHLNSKPVATVLYDPWLGWQLDYYLGVWHDKRRVHYPSAESLAAGAAALDEREDRFFVAPSAQNHAYWLERLREVGFGIALDYESAGYVVWRLSPRQSRNP